MASKLHNLSEYNPDTLPDKALLQGQRYAVVVSDWNANVTFPLLEGALQTLEQQGITQVSVTHVPGAFELTYAAKEYQNTGRYQAVIVLGCVIQGDTPHFDYVCSGCTQGISRLNTREGKAPVIFGVLTVRELQQALERAGGSLGNKGVEAAITAIKMANIHIA